MLGILILLFWSLSAEAAHPPALSLAKQNAHKIAISSWEIQGALAAKNNKAKGWSATMHWKQAGPNIYQIRLMGPLGSGAVLIQRQGRMITFQDGSKKISSTNANDLLLKQTGIRLPVDNLYYWVRGLAAPGPVQLKKQDKYQRLQQLRQDGYTIEFGEFVSVQGLELPRKIRMEGKGLMVKVLIKSWKVSTASLAKNRE